MEDLPIGVEIGFELFKKEYTLPRLYL